MKTIPGLPPERFWTVGKLASGAIGVVYVIASALFLGPADALQTVIFLVLPLFMIWMPEMMGQYTGWGVLQGRPIMKQSPIGLVKVFGWIVLFLPVVLMLIANR